MTDDLPPNEFSRPILVASLSGVEKTYDLVASPAELAALTERLGILGVDSLSARVKLKLMAGGELVRLRGTLEAKVRQACVVTLDPVRAAVSEAFELFYGIEPDSQEGEIVVDLEVEDPPEPIIDGAIDMGEAVAEHLALGLEPFPRAPGAVYDSPEEPAPEPVKANPFAALAALKKK